MAKIGLEYYRFYTNRYQNIKIKRLKREYGCDGIAIYDYILTEIYRDKGCFIEWDESRAFDVADYFNIKESLVNEVVKGCGQIEGKVKYVFYYEEKGLYRMIQLDYNLVQIKYSEGKPKINIIENYPSDAFINNFAIDLDIFNKIYIIEVPKGTIKNNYNLDAQ